MAYGPQVRTSNAECVPLLPQALETFWLKNTNFVAGNQISIADLLLCTELSGLRLIDGAVKVRPRLLAGSSAETWMLGQGQ